MWWIEGSDGNQIRLFEMMEALVLSNIGLTQTQFP
jgi:hypothetical protein